jgi:subfamily B ATP-binding cassette protein MsbA
MLKDKYQKLLPDQSALALVRRLLLEQAGKRWRAYVMAFALMGIGAACTALMAYLMGSVINEAYVARNFPGIVALGLLAMAIFVVKGLSTYGQQVMLARVGNSIVAENQRRMFSKLLQQNVSYFSERHSTEFLARLTTGATAASGAINLLITAVGRDALSLLALLIVMIIQDPMMSLFSLVVVPPALLVLRKLIRRIYAIAKAQFTGGARILETMQETMQGLRIVKAFTLEDTMRARLEAQVSDVEREANKMARVSNRASPLMEALGGCAIALALIYGGYRVIETGATPGEFFSFITAFLLAYEPAKRLTRLNMELNAHLFGVRVLFDIIDSPASEPPDEHKPALQVGPGRVEFVDVQFAYRADEPVLRGVSLVAEPGRMTALVGSSGGGKSTILNLLLRFHEVGGGTILIDGQNIAEVSRRSLRRQIAYVGQDVFLFRGTVRENIAFGKPGATQDEIVAAARAACAHEFIMAFPAGYDTPVGEHGLQLSGGQRQRIAVARALIKDAHLILLDEATAALDSESERQVQEAIEHLCEGRTTLVIAHRLHTVMHADRIYVVDDGAIVEAGRHDELMRKGSRYATFYRLQLANQEPRGSVTPIASTA